MTSASTVVVGGGVIGASVAWHLASRGAEVLVIDRALGPGLGSTGAATGGFRAQFGSTINVKLSLLAREKLRRFREEVGADPGYVEAGYLWLAESEIEAAWLREARAVQRAAGLLEAIEVSAAEVRRLQPVVGAERVVAAAYCPTDGFIRPVAILDGYRRAAERLGARFLWSEPVTGFDLDGDRIVGVRTPRATIACGAVVNAAGAWAAQVARLAGVELPVTPVRRQMAATVPTRAVHPGAPMTLFCGDGLHFRERDGRVIVSSADQRLPSDPFDVSVEPAWIDALGTVKNARLPGLREVPIDPAACWAGLYEMSPDRRAILGSAGSPRNLWLVNGSSGHGVMHSPALGQLASELVLDGRASSLDVSALAADRFADGRAIESAEVL